MSSSPADPLERLVRFGNALRDEGISVGSAHILDFCRAAALLAPADLYWAGRATLVSRPDDIPVYDRLFVEAFGPKDESFQRAPRPEPEPEVPVIRPAREVGPDEDGDNAEDPTVSLASSVERIRNKSFEEYSEEELRTFAAACGDLLVATRRSRRYHSARSGAPDLRRTLRSSMRTVGEPVNRAWRARRATPRRVVMLLDISGSMATYSRALLFFAHAGVRAQRRWEVFCFATRLTPITRALTSGTPDAALRRATDAVVDWDGGTRIGDSVKRLLDDHGRGRMVRGAIVVICSDGLEFGDPEMLGAQMERLSRLAHRVIWLNPLKQDPAYEPLARGMRAALPSIDVFAGGHNLASLEAVARALSAAVESGPAVTTRLSDGISSAIAP